MKTTKHRKMLLVSIGLILAGAILWQVVGPVLIYLGTEQYTTGWWIFSEAHHYLSPLGYVGVGLTIGGLSLLIIGIGMMVVTVILELTEKKQNHKT